RDGPLARERLERHSVEAVRGRDHDGIADAVDVEARIEEARGPGRVDGPQIVGEAGRERHDRADGEIAVRLSVHPASDAGGDAVVDARVAQRAGDADTGDDVVF